MVMKNTARRAGMRSTIHPHTFRHSFATNLLKNNANVVSIKEMLGHDNIQTTMTYPKSHPNKHTETEIKLIKDMRRRNPNIGLQDLWIKLKKRGYTRTQPALFKVLKRLKRHQDKTNNRPMRPLDYKSPKQVLEEYKNKQLEK